MKIAKAVTTVLDYVRAGKAPPLAENDHDLLRTVVNGFANVGESSVVAIGRPRPPAAELRRLHEQFCADLQAIIENRLDSASRRRIVSEADRLVLVPRRDENDKRVFDYLPESLPTVLAYSLWLLLDPEQPYRSDLKQCQWKDCRLDIPGTDIRRFFFMSDRRKASRTGKLPDTYCDEEHMKAAHRARATQATMERRRKEREERERKLAAKAKK